MRPAITHWSDIIARPRRVARAHALQQLDPSDRVEEAQLRNFAYWSAGLNSGGATVLQAPSQSPEASGWSEKEGSCFLSAPLPSLRYCSSSASRFVSRLTLVVNTKRDWDVGGMKVSMSAGSRLAAREYEQRRWY
jgi:hypothetical protein